MDETKGTGAFEAPKPNWESSRSADPVPAAAARRPVNFENSVLLSASLGHEDLAEGAAERDVKKKIEVGRVKTFKEAGRAIIMPAHCFGIKTKKLRAKITRNFIPARAFPLEVPATANITLLGSFFLKVFI